MEKIYMQFGKNFHNHTFGEIRIQSVFCQRLCILKQLVKSRLRASRNQMQRQQPPWHAAWLRMVSAIISLSKDIIWNLMKATNLGIFQKRSVYAMIPPHLSEHPNRCKHENIKRSGNQHGKYAQCLQCLRKFRWNQEAGQWEFNPLPESSRSSPLPAPSCNNTRPMVAVPKTKSKPAGKGKSKGPMRTTATHLTPTGDLPVFYDMEGDLDMDLGYPEEHMTTAQAMYDHLPENQAELEEIIRRGQEASLRLQQSLEEEDATNEAFDWETPGS